MGSHFESESDNVDSRRNLNDLNPNVACRCGKMCRCFDRCCHHDTKTKSRLDGDDILRIKALNVNIFHVLEEEMA
jgi:hypothetical protein